VLWQISEAISYRLEGRPRGINHDDWKLEGEVLSQCVVFWGVSNNYFDDIARAAVRPSNEDVRANAIRDLMVDLGGTTLIPRQIANALNVAECASDRKREISSLSGRPNDAFSKNADCSAV